jgi:hypothetical protein
MLSTSCTEDVEERALCASETLRAARDAQIVVLRPIACGHNHFAQLENATPEATIALDQPTRQASAQGEAQICAITGFMGTTTQSQRNRYTLVHGNSWDICRHCTSSRLQLQS